MIIDCGGTLRCGIYPQKRIPTININPVGKSGPMAKYITEDIYVSGVKNDNICIGRWICSTYSEAAPAKEEKDFKYSADKKVSETMGSSSKSSFIQKIGMGAGKVVATFNSAAKESTNTVLHTIIPFMGFVSLLIGIIQDLDSVTGLLNYYSHYVEISLDL